jgi:hypothetical protein
MNSRIKGILSSEPKPADADRKRITFILINDETKRAVSCASDLRFDTSVRIKNGANVILIGDWETGCFRFHSAGQSNPGKTTAKD